MARQYAQLAVVGNLGQDAETTFTPNGNARTRFSLARNKTIQGESFTNWFNVTLWGKFGEALQQYLLKGTNVLVTGDFFIREYEKNDGTVGISYDIEARDLVLLSSGENGEAAKPAVKPKPAPKKTTKKAVDEDDSFGVDDDIPF